MTIDTQEALRLLGEIDAVAMNLAAHETLREASDRYDIAVAKLRALLSAKEGEPSAWDWRRAFQQIEAESRQVVEFTFYDEVWTKIEQRAIALRDAEKEKGNAG